MVLARVGHAPISTSEQNHPPRATRTPIQPPTSTNQPIDFTPCCRFRWFCRALPLPLVMPFAAAFVGCAVVVGVRCLRPLVVSLRLLPTLYLEQLRLRFVLSFPPQGFGGGEEGRVQGHFFLGASSFGHAFFFRHVFNDQLCPCF